MNFRKLPSVFSFIFGMYLAQHYPEMSPIKIILSIVLFSLIVAAIQAVVEFNYKTQTINKKEGEE